MEEELLEMVADMVYPFGEEIGDMQHTWPRRKLGMAGGAALYCLQEGAGSRSHGRKQKA